MARNIRTEAIVLKTGRVGDIHKSVTLFTPSHGIIDAIAHGVFKGKGKLASVTDPFALSTAYLYYEPVKKNYKITDMDPLDLFEGVRGDLDRFYAASLWSEVIIRSHAGGEGVDRVFELLKEGLVQLGGESDPRCVQIQFLWRFVALSGFLPDIEACAVCGREVPDGEPLIYRRSEGDFACRDCMRGADAGLPQELLSPGARKYVERTEQLPFDVALRVDLEQRAKEDLLGLLYQLIQDLLEVPLKTLRAGVL